jgi:acetolactate synthase-1/2/3 large subunit
MKSRMKLGDYLVDYLQKIGVSHLFGIPGDLVIKLFLKFGRLRGLKVITLSHEPAVGFAADGYARSTGRIGVICATSKRCKHEFCHERAPLRSVRNRR